MKKFLIIIGILLILVSAFAFFSFSTFVVAGGSMEPSLKDGDKILVFKTAYLFSKPERGNLILANLDNKTMVKRIVGLPGETIEVKDGKIKINDKILYESYIKEIQTYGDQRVILLDNQYYLLGDNREPNQSTDSRIYGPISKKNIRGKVIANFSPNFKILKNQLYQFAE